MSYTRFSVKTTHEAADTLCAVLSDCGVEAFEIEDKKDMLAFFEQNRALYDYIDEGLINMRDSGVFVHIYLEGDGGETLKAVKNALSKLDKGVFGSLETFTAEVANDDWQTSWKKYFHITPVGEKLLICPEWENPEKTERAVFRVDPGQVFGTGTHESTRLCMELAEEYIKGGEKVLDLGCGTGILGITACLLGAKSADFADINENARAAVLHNCEINGVTAGEIRICNILESDFAGYDAVFANIVSDVIIAAAEKLRRVGKALIASGIIDTREAEVRAALEKAGFALIKAKKERGWVAFLMK